MLCKQIHTPMTTKNKRTGIVVQRKKFPPGGVGARNVALHNKIATHALTPSFTASYIPYNPNNPFWKTENLLFDLESFSNPSLNINLRHIHLLRAAATRWKNHINFTDESIAVIRKDMPSWKGIFIHVYNESNNPAVDESYWYGSVISEPLRSNSELFYKFSLTLNLAYIPLSDDMLLDMFTRLLGIAMGFNPASSSRFRATYIEGSGGRYSKLPLDDGNVFGTGGYARGLTRNSMGEPSFPNLMNAYEKYNGTVTGNPPHKIVKGDDADGIPMGRSVGDVRIPLKFRNGNEYSIETVTDDYGWKFPKFIKLGIENEIMSVDTHRYKGYISDLSLGFFSDLYSVVDNKKVFTYRKKGTNEIVNFENSFISGVFAIHFNLVNGQLVQNNE